MRIKDLQAVLGISQELSSKVIKNTPGCPSPYEVYFFFMYSIYCISRSCPNLDMGISVMIK